MEEVKLREQYEQFHYDVFVPSLRTFYQNCQSYKDSYPKLRSLLNSIQEYCGDEEVNDTDYIDFLLNQFKVIFNYQEEDINHNIKEVCQAILGYKYTTFILKNIIAKGLASKSPITYDGYLDDYEVLLRNNMIISEKNERQIYRLFGYDIYLPIQSKELGELYGLLTQKDTIEMRQFKFCKYQFNPSEYHTFLVDAFRVSGPYFFIMEGINWNLRGLLSRKRITKCSSSRRIIYQSPYLKLYNGTLKKIEGHEY